MHILIDLFRLLQVQLLYRVILEHAITANSTLPKVFLRETFGLRGNVLYVPIQPRESLSEVSRSSTYMLKDAERDTDGDASIWRILYILRQGDR